MDAHASARNHLAGERSLYLQQHAGNQLDWYPWGEAAFAKARAEDKLILLSVGYSSCYWCHVMEDEVFSRRDVADLVNPRFVCIKVDREERPDVDAAYMEAARLMTGSGGWPLNVWLTPELRPVYAGTYFPKEHFLAVCDQLDTAWQRDRAQFDSVGSEVVAAVNDTVARAKPGSITTALLDRAAQVILAHGDPQWGGLMSRVKFPEPVLWEFLLHYYARTQSGDVRNLLTVTLDSMADGGLFDHVGGGFHRYSTDRQWLVPHFEKMLYDNAQLASLYFDAARVLEDPRYTAVARGTLDFMLREMRLENGSFAASFDASTSEGEGAYYVWTPEQLREVAGEDAPQLARELGVSDVPNFSDHHGRVSGSVVTRRAHDGDGLFEKYRDKLNQVRSRRLAPARDDKVVTAWNAMAISALAKAGEVEAAERCAQYLWQRHRLPDGCLCRASNDGTLGAPAILEDYALLAQALLDLHERSPYGKHLQHALELVEHVKGNFARPECGYFQTPASSDLPFARQVNLSDTVEPSGNSVMAHVLLKAALLTGDIALYESAGGLLDSLAGHAQEQPLESGHMLSAADLLIGPHYLAVVAGPQDAAQTLADELRSVPTLNSSIVTIDEQRFSALPEALRSLQPVLAGKPALDVKPTVYVCKHGTCSAPVHDATHARELLLAR